MISFFCQDRLDFSPKPPISATKKSFTEKRRFSSEFPGFSLSKFKFNAVNSIETVIESDENLIISEAFEIIPIISEVIQCSKTKRS